MKFYKFFFYPKVFFLNIFLFFYCDIYIYTSGKSHDFFRWLFYVDESLNVLKGNRFKLLFYILYLYLTGKMYWFFNKCQLFYCDVVELWILNFNYLLNILIEKRFFFYLQLHAPKKQHFINLFSLIKFVLKKTFFVLAPYVAFIYFTIKNCLIPFFFFFIIFIFLIFFFQISFLKQIAAWFIMLNLIFWLLSGFNFFLKRARFGKFTGAAQRFWKRANMCFWLVEGFLFLIFYYYYLNSSQEPLYMNDSSSLNQEYLLSITSAYASLSLLSFVIFTLIAFTIAMPSLGMPQIVLILSITSIAIFYMFYLESYQFYYLLNSFSEVVWVYNDDLNLWKSTYEAPRLRTKYYYFLLCLMAKYWHFVFIFSTWCFFIIKSYEEKRVRYPMLGYITQNCIILYVLNLLTYVQWIKWMFHRFLDGVYFWFYQNYDSKVWGEVFAELKLLVIKDFEISKWYDHYSKFAKHSIKYFFYGDSFNYYEAIEIFWRVV